MEQIILIIHVVIAIGIIALILIQHGKGADMGASFGSGGSQAVFGPAGGGNLLTRATAVLAALFFVTSFSLAIIAKNKAAEFSDLGVASGVETQVEPAADNLQGLIPQAVEDSIIEDEIPE